MRTFKITLGGESFVATPLTLGDIEELLDWARKGYLERVRKSVESANGVFTEDEKKLRIVSALDRVAEMSMNSSETKALLESPDGMAHIMYHCLKREQDITTDAILELSPTEYEISEFMSQIDGSMGTSSSITGSNHTKKKKKRR